MKKLIKFVLYAFIGLVISFILAMVSETIHAIVTCAIAGLAAAIIVYMVSEKTGLQKILAIVAFIVAFFLYSIPYRYVNEEGESFILFAIVWGIPYILAAAALIEGSNERQ